MDENKLSLITTCKQAVMKLESAMTDMNEIKESDLLDEKEKDTFDSMIEITGNIMATIVNMVSKDMDEEEFMGETINMDELNPYPEKEIIKNLMDEKI